MKKYFSNIRTLAALLMAGAAFAACSSDENSIDQPADPTAPKTYTLTVNASKGANAATRALKLDGEKLVAKWAYGEELAVYKANDRFLCSEENKLGTISPVAGSISADGDKATFKGTLSGSVSVTNGDKLMLIYHPEAFNIDDFISQTGTLESASNLDHATASVTASVSGTDITIAETSVSFSNHMAMLKLTLQDYAGNKLNATQLKMTLPSPNGIPYDFTFSPTDATYTANGGDGVLYFALPSAEDIGIAEVSATITYTATVGTDTYVATKANGYPFKAGKYYAGTLTMKPIPQYTAPTAKTGLAYNGESQELVNAGSVTDGTMYYSLNGSDWSTTVPTGTNAGNYRVYYKIEGDANHADVDQQDLSVTIGKKTPTLTVSATSVTFTQSDGVGSTKEVEITYDGDSDIIFDYSDDRSDLGGIDTVSYGYDTTTKKLTITRESTENVNVIIKVGTRSTTNYSSVQKDISVKLEKYE